MHYNCASIITLITTMALSRTHIRRYGSLHENQKDLEKSQSRKNHYSLKYIYKKREGKPLLLNCTVDTLVKNLKHTMWIRWIKM